jgi:hypothetical protein
MLHSIPTVECQTGHCIPDEEEVAVTKILGSSASFNSHGNRNNPNVGWWNRHTKLNIQLEMTL